MNIVDITKYQALPINQLVKADWNYKELEEQRRKILTPTP